MKHTVTIYPGDYQIKSLGGIDYLHCENPREEKFVFEGKGYTKDFFKQLLSMDLEDIDAVRAFTNQYGILVNTQNDPENPTYLGKITTKKFNKEFLSFPTGYSMPLSVFRNYIIFIKNLLLLATAISLKYPAGKEFTENSVRTVEFFLTVLLQPYGYHGIINSGINWIIDGNTPLTCLAYYNGRFSSEMSSLFNASRCMHLFINAMQTLNADNLRLLHEFESNPEHYKTPEGVPVFPAKLEVHYRKSPDAPQKIFSISDLEVKDFISPDYTELCRIFNAIKQNFSFSFTSLQLLNIFKARQDIALNDFN